jgi:hypothetical protein
MHYSHHDAIVWKPVMPTPLTAKEVEMAAVSDLEKLAEIIRERHGVEATHLRSDPVHGTFREDTVRGGVVEVFAIVGDSRTNIAYAWSHETDAGRRYVAVLRFPPVLTATAAVRAAIITQSQNR